VVYDVNAIDIIGERNDGGIDLFIISSGKLEDSVEQQTLLLDKIENYLVYLIVLNLRMIFQMSLVKINISN